MSIFFSGNTEEKNQKRKGETNSALSGGRTFVEKMPSAILNCFSRPSFLFYLVILLLQLFIDTEISKLITMVPLLLNISTSILIDISRRLKKRGFSKRINKRKVLVLKRNSWVMENWSNIKTGDLIKINNGDYVPADVVMIFSSDNQPASIDSYIIDGSSQWHPASTPNIPDLTESSLINSRFTIYDMKRDVIDNPEMVKPMYTLKYTFTAKLDFKNKDYELTDKNLIERYSVVYHSGYIIGAVIYTGKDCWSAINYAKKLRQTKIEKNLRKMNVWQIEFVTILSLILSYINNKLYKPENYIFSFSLVFLKFVLVLLPIITLELFAFVDLANVFMSMLLQNQYKKAFFNSLDAMDELCNVNALVVSKSMLLERKPCLKRIFLNGKTYGSEMTSRQLSLDIDNALISSKPLVKNFFDPNLLATDENKMFFLHLSLCHAASIVGKNKTFNYISRFPDDEQLLTLAANYGFMLVGRTQDTSQVLIGDKLCTFKTKRIIHSCLKHPRISIIVEDSEGNIILFTRGVFRVMLATVNNIDKYQFIYNQFHEEGLHTECISYRVLSKEEYNAFESKLAELGEEYSDFWFATIEALESNSTFISAFGFEDRPRKGSLLFLSRAKQSFNQIIISSMSRGSSLVITEIALGMVKSNPVEGTIKGQTLDDVDISISYLLEQSKYDVLIITGQSIEYLPQSEYSDEIMNIISNTPTIILQRADPVQVGEFIEYLQKYTKQCVMGIGHCVYDSIFMEKSDISISIPTTDIRPNAISADVVVNGYEQLADLTFIDGNIMRERINTMIKFITPRNLMFAFFQLWRSVFMNFTPKLLFNGVMYPLIMYVFTAAPILLRSIFNNVQTRNSLLSDSCYYKRNNRNYITLGRNLMELIVALAVTLMITILVKRWTLNSVESPTFIFVIASCFVLAFNAIIIPTVSNWNLLMRIGFFVSNAMFYLFYFIWTSLGCSNENQGVFGKMMENKAGFAIIAAVVFTSLGIQFIATKKPNKRKGSMQL